MKKFLNYVLCMGLVVSMLAGCSSKSPDAEKKTLSAEEETGNSDAKNGKKEDSINIGVAIYDLNDPNWANVANSMKTYAASMGVNVTMVSANSNAATQVSQMENFIENGVDAIVVGAVDPASLSDVAKRAQDKGIKVYAWSFPLEYYDAELLVNDKDLGYAIGKAAGEWINEKYDGKAKVGMLDYPEQDILITRADGILEGLKDTCPGAEVVATAAAVTVPEGLSATENFLQAHPDMKVITCIGDGGAVGANEAVKAAGIPSEEFGIFSAGALLESLQAIKNGDPIKFTAGLGSEDWRAKQVMDTVISAVKGEEFEKTAYYPIESVSMDNLEEYAAENGLELK